MCFTVSFAPAKKKLDDTLRDVGQALAGGVARLAKKDLGRVHAFLQDCADFFGQTQKTAEEIGQARVGARQLTERLWEMKAVAAQVAEKRELLAWMGGRDAVVEEDVGERLDAVLSRLQGFEGDVQKKVESLRGEWEEKARAVDRLLALLRFLPRTHAHSTPLSRLKPPLSLFLPALRRRTLSSRGPPRSRAAGSSSRGRSGRPRVRKVTTTCCLLPVPRPSARGGA